MATEVRTAVPADLPDVLALLRQLHLDDPPVPDGVAASTWKAILRQPYRTVLVACRDARVVGTAELTLAPNLTRGARPFGVVENVAVDSRVRRQGVGRALLQHATALARDARAYKVQLASGGAEATAFYAAVGWRVTGQTMAVRFDD